MYQDYVDDIVNYYRTGSKNAAIPQRLIRPTPASIKEECLSAFNTRFQKKDTLTLTGFFKVEDDPDAILKAMRRCERDRFKPLANFLIGKSYSTDHLNIELLAWLIDFANRPYKEENYKGIKASGELQNRIISEETVTLDKEPISERFKTGNAVSPEKRAPHFNIRKKGAIVIVSSILLVLVSFFITKKKEAVFGVTNPDTQKCMMWAGDHYEPTTCEPKHDDTLVVALDLQRIEKFKRITRPDTITVLSAGKLWYIKRNGQIEYYTGGGKHPVEPDRVLKPLTKYIIEKYITSLQQ